MTTHIKAITYEPKIPDVMNGKCRQTIRKVKDDERIEPGDKIIFICWIGRLHRWKSWQKIVWVDTTYNNFLIYPDSFEIFGTCYRWDSSMADIIAKEDGIVPATGPALHDVIVGIYGPIPPDGMACQVIRW